MESALKDVEGVKKLSEKLMIKQAKIDEEKKRLEMEHNVSD